MSEPVKIDAAMAVCEAWIKAYEEANFYPGRNQQLRIVRALKAALSLGIVEVETAVLEAFNALPATTKPMQD